MSDNQTNVSITIRPLTLNEATRLSLALRDTPNILGYRPQELTRFSDAIVATAPGTNQLAGVCLIKKLPQNWVDIAVIFVFPEYRRQGIGSQLFDTAMKQLREQKKTILCVSREPSILKLMEKEGMQFISSVRFPFRVNLCYSQHYNSLYRSVEAIRKRFRYPNQPPFRYAIIRP